MATTLTVLAVYRAILRQGRLQLKLTDQSFFRKMVREEFQKRKGERHSEEVQFQMQVSYFAFIVTLSLHSHAESQTFLADKSRWIIVTLMISKKQRWKQNHHPITIETKQKMTEVMLRLQTVYRDYLIEAFAFD